MCAAMSPVFDFSLVCCRVRYIVNEPRLEVRRAWLERWKRKDGAMGEAVEREVAAR